MSPAWSPFKWHTSKNIAKLGVTTITNQKTKSKTQDVGYKITNQKTKSKTQDVGYKITNQKTKS